MSGVPADVLAKRVISALERAVVANDNGDQEKARVELETTREWVEKLREAMR